MTVIEQGLKPGEQVVIDGQMRVIPGGKVEIKQPEKAVTPKPVASAAPAKPEKTGTAGK
jgi:multidrug efflux system membrane fusion protein